MTHKKQIIQSGTTDKGASLVTVIFLLSVVSLVFGAIYTLTRKNLIDVSSEYWKDRARYAAQAGVQHALIKLNNDSTWNVSLLDQPVKENPELSYDIEILNNLHATPSDPVVNDPYDGLVIPPGTCWIRATGKMSDRVSVSSSSMVKLVGGQRPIYNHSVFTMGPMTLNNVTSTEFDSDPATAPPMVPGNPQAHIGTNSVTNNSVSGNLTTLAGHVFVGVSTAAANLTNVATVTIPVGSSKLISEKATLVPRYRFGDLPAGTPDDAPLAGATIVMNEGGYVYRGSGLTLAPTGGTVQFGPGTIMVYGDLTIADGTTIECTGNPAAAPAEPANGCTTLYVIGGDLTIGDNVTMNTGLNFGDDPQQLQIAMGTYKSVNNGGDPRTVTIGTGADLYCLISGFTANVTTNGGDIHGALLVDELTANNTNFIYDVSLRDQLTESSGEIAVLTSSVDRRGSNSPPAVPTGGTSGTGAGTSGTTSGGTSGTGAPGPGSYCGPPYPLPPTYCPI